MVDKVTSDARVYTDVQGLEQLRYAAHNHSSAAKKEVSQQFEAILMQIVMRSMRDANKAFASDLLGNDQMDMYQDLFDKQISMLASNGGVGFAKIVENNIDQTIAANNKTHGSQAKTLFELKRNQQTPGFLPIGQSAERTLPIRDTQTVPTTIMAVPSQAPVATEKKEPSFFATPEEFVKSLWSYAKEAANTIGADPRILIAQAALETNWGKKILPHDQTNSSYNLFNIKADNSWDKPTTTAATLEQKNGVIAKEKADFRSYASFKDSFRDYVRFLKENGRYSKALSKAASPTQFVHALQNAGFATDASYADKILQIFDSHHFQQLMAKMAVMP